MWTQTVETTLSPTVTVEECVGDLNIRGADEPRLTISLHDDADALVLSREGETFSLLLRADCHLICPRDARLTLSAVRGDLRVRRVRGPLTAGSVSGDAAFQQVGPLTLGEIYGNLSVRGAAGEVRIGEVFGDARLRDVDGPLSTRAVRGDLSIAGLRGDATAETVSADLHLRPPYVPGVTCRFQVSGKARIVVPTDADLRLVLRSRREVRSTVPGLNLTEEDDATAGVLGDGSALLEVTAAGPILLVQEVAERSEWSGVWVAGTENIGAVIETSIAEAMALLETRLEESLHFLDREEIRRRVELAAERACQALEHAARRAREVAEREAERARREAERRAEQARREAEQRAEQARREAERRAEQARREAERARMRAERAERRWQRVTGQRPHPTRPATADEEILRVLRLVEEGKITPEQAAELIAALEGR